MVVVVAMVVAETKRLRSSALMLAFPPPLPLPLGLQERGAPFVALAVLLEEAADVGRRRGRPEGGLAGGDDEKPSESSSAAL